VATLLVLLFASAVVLLSARPAAAHDSLISTDPANGAAVDSLPSELTLSFSAVLLSDEGGTVVEVTDAAGTDLTDGTPTVDQNVVTQPLTGSASGVVTVLWRVVSSDGHPVSGEYSFTVTGVSTPAPTATSSAAPSSPAPAITAPTSSQATPVTAPDDEDVANPLPWVIGGIVLVVLIAVVIALLAARARHGKDTEETRTAGREHPGDD
jgi:methionine-rich copper-binding protein CopC